MKKISNRELENLVGAYQWRSQEAAEELSQAYEAYFQKFVNLIKHGKLEMQDRTLRKFISNFLSKEERANVKKFVKSNYIQSVLVNRAEWLKFNLSFLEEYELRSEMMIILLEMADGHEGESFRTYVSVFFPKKLAKRLLKMMKDNRAYNEHTETLNDNIIEIGHEDEYDLENDKRIYHIQATEPTLFDENWINGYDCDDVFNELTPHERRIIKLYYEWRTIGRRDALNGNKREIDKDLYEEMKDRLKLTEAEIADRFGCSRKTINVKRNEVKKRVEELAHDLRLIKG